MKLLRKSRGIEHETFHNSSVFGMSGNKFALIAVPISLCFWALVLYLLCIAIDAKFDTGIINFLTTFFN